MTSSHLFSIEESDNFKRSFRRLAKVHKGSFVELIAKALKDLIDDQYPNNSRQESLLGKVDLPKGRTFHKLELRIAKGGFRAN
nr:hypothetical protein [Leptolyngbya sp. FACHB-671]